MFCLFAIDSSALPLFFFFGTKFEFTKLAFNAQRSIARLKHLSADRKGKSSDGEQSSTGGYSPSRESVSSEKAPVSPAMPNLSVSEEEDGDEK